MNIIFKNVGQGDSIIVELNRDDGFNTGIIDCHKLKGENPVIQHLVDNEVEKILFIILSHPHYDHYSGLLELLEFCEQKNIHIKRFAHTANHHISYMQWYELEANKVALLEQIFLKIDALYRVGLIQHIGNVTQDWQIQLDDHHQLKCLSPSDHEIRRYYKQAKFLQDTDRLKCSQAANLLSTVFKIEQENDFILLTSDAEKTTFQRLHDTCMDDYFSGELRLCQIPHHGALANHHPQFWSDLKRKPNCPAAISVGEHKRYKHPHVQVVERFEEMKYRIYSTNYIQSSYDFDKVNDKLSLALSTHNPLIEQYHIEADQIFTFTEGRVQEVV